MEAHITEWLHLAARWVHFIVGIAWIGASFYFNWLENQLDRRQPQEAGVAGNLWAVHGGGFYHLRKYQTTPPQLPEQLHWFKWEAYNTWISGMVLLVLVYYTNAEAMLFDTPEHIATPIAVLVGLTGLALSWLVYDLLCRLLGERPLVLLALLLLYLIGLAWVLETLLSGRAAYIHVGAAIGTIMVGNVFFVIIPAQRALVTALQSGQAPDPAIGKGGLLRSRHNNYFTLPVLLIMISNHFPGTYSSNNALWILLALATIGVLVRHYFNVRHRARHSWGWLAGAIAAFAVLMVLTAPKRIQAPSAANQITTAQIMPIIYKHCTQCHASEPTQAGFGSAPKGIVLSTTEQLRQHADIVNAVTANGYMPLGNITSMTDAERKQVLRWYAGLQEDGQ